MARSVEVTAEGKRPDPWADSLGRVGVRSAQILLILDRCCGVRLRPAADPAPGHPGADRPDPGGGDRPFVNVLKRRGLPGAAATGLAFVALLAVLAGVTTVIVVSIRSQWSELVSQAVLRAG